MFNTFNLFNFFQQPNTGKVPVRGSYNVAEIESVNGVSGRVADFNWRFPYVNRATPATIFQRINLNSVFSINLFSDAETDEYIGVRKPISSLNISGEIYKDINKSYSDFRFSGNFFPHSKDSSNLNTFVSGSVGQSSVNFYVFNNLISGEVSSSNLNFNNLNNQISGFIFDAKTNFTSSQINVSGTLKEFDFSKNINDLKISGSFFPIYKDLANLEYYISGYSTEYAAPKLEIQNSDELTNLNYYISEYSVGG